LRSRAAKLLKSTAAGSRADVLAEYGPALKLEGRVLRGWVVFGRTCAACHRYRERGNDIGADLAALKNKTAPALLEAVLDPNRAVEAKFRQYVAATTDGRVYDGMVLAETTTSLTLARPNGRRDVILRKDLEELAATGKSFMPEGLEKDLSPQDVADVIAFLQSATEPGRAGPDRDDAPRLGAAALHGVLDTAEQAASKTKRHARTWLGEVEAPCCSADGSGSRLTWRMMPPPERPLRLRFAVAMGGETGTFTFKANGEPLLSFPPLVKDAEVTSPDGRTALRFLAMQAGENQASGVVELETSAESINAETVEFEVAPAASTGDAWFALLPVSGE
ncbi:MAG: c-type cytochrome, partial [Planctomycetaceae bacterium]